MARNRGELNTINWGGFEFNSRLLVEVEECCICHDKKPIDEILGNGMCRRCTEIENNLMERLAGKWGQMVLEQENARYNAEIMQVLEQNQRNGWF